jgi:Tfp pilus assembly protein PilX
MRVHKRNQQCGVALILTMFALVLLSALAASLVLVATTETSINYNYRSEQSTFFAARAGVAEAADRLMSTTASTPVITPPSVVPGAAGGVVYLINQGTLSKTVQPWVASTANSPNPYMDDELCHDGYTISGLTSTPPDVPCTTVPSGSSWYTTVTSNAPWSGTAAALPYVWARITLKLNGSVPHLNPGTTPTTTDYYVNSTQSATSQVCWNGVSEVIMTAASCQAMGDTNVYLITALAVTPSGSRTMVQSEVTVSSTPGTSFGLFANSTACPAITFTGNGSTDSYSTAGYTSATASGAYAATVAQTGGDIGTNGTVSLGGNAAIGGSVGAKNAVIGNCPDGLSNNAHPGIVANPLNVLMAIPQTIFPTPPVPNPLPPTTNVTYTSAASLTPGSYGNISLSGHATLTLAPGVYNFNSLSIAGQGTLTISPAGAIVINIAGTGQANPIAIAGNGISNPSSIPNNVLINYAGTGTVSVAGNGNTYCVVDAPNSALTYAGNGNFFGAMIGGTITDSGNGAVHYDRNVQAATIQANGNYITLAFRELPY